MTPLPADVYALLKDRPGAVWLDGGGSGPWSVIVWDPVERVTDGADWPALGRALTGHPGRSSDSVPFDGGCVGYVGYGAGHRVEAVPAEAPTPEPELWLGAYEGGLCFRHADATWHPAGTASFRADAVRWLERATPLPPPPPAPRPRSVRTTPRLVFENGVRRILDLIAAGDCYQVALTRPVHVLGAGDPWAAYRRLRAASAPAFGAYLRLDDDVTVLSNSPELFLSVDGRQAASLPIKGTRPRHTDPTCDAAFAQELALAGKDRAELTMIVDLVRNDLGRVATPGTVTTGPREITAHANVHHASQQVSCELAAGIDPWDALAATFPPGSVTGAPKVRACERIAELEPEPRGAYCGAIGYVSRSGRARWSVAIRTASWVGDHARYHVGGGIVAESDPAAEWWETVHKGSALGRALTGEPHPELVWTEADPAAAPRIRVPVE